MLDAHCHLGVEFTPDAASQLAKNIKSEDVTFCLMSTNGIDLPIIAEIAQEAHNVVPYYGVHPWYSHLFAVEELLDKKEHYTSILDPKPNEELLSILPEPVSLQKHLEKIRELVGICESEGRRYGIGEIGLDKLFRIPSNGFYGNQLIKEDVKLTNSKVTMKHQLEVFKQQLELALELQVSVSMHCVKAHGPFFDTVKKYSIPNIVLHSYSGSVDQAKAWVREYKKRKELLMFSFSNYINATENKLSVLGQLVGVLGDEQILTETDMPLDRFFPKASEQYYSHLDGIMSALRGFKGWDKKDAELLLTLNTEALLNNVCAT